MTARGQSCPFCKPKKCTEITTLLPDFVQALEMVRAHCATVEFQQGFVASAVKNRFRKCERGISAMEYAMIAGLIALALLIVLSVGGKDVV